jgi:hypothetical protein
MLLIIPALFLIPKVAAGERMAQSKGQWYKMETGMPNFSPAFS